VSEQRDKWNRRHAEAPGLGAVAEVLQRNTHLLPQRGRALDLACGRGANALWLAERGLRVQAWDFAASAIARLRQAAASRGIEVQTQVRDVLAEPPGSARFDVVLVSHFLERGLFPALLAALRPGGRLFYQTFTREGADQTGPSNPVFRLAPNELLKLCSGLLIRYYREDGAADGGGTRGLALLVAERPD
jgi:2-polyprenyl-3-methyl-5-hydroxy-6-metoxy-1,4-benzoquinol methylase